jgi:hypothetical protein
MQKSDDNQQQIVFPPEPPPDLDPAQHHQFLRCLQYILLHEIGNPPMKKQDIAAQWKIHRDTLNTWVNDWTATGLLERCRKMYLTPLLVDDVIAAGTDVLRDWREIMKRQIKTAKSSGSDQFALQAAMWLHEVYVKPAIDNLPDVGDEELEYLRQLSQAGVLNPLSISDGGAEEEASTSGVEFDNSQGDPLG